MGLLDDAIREHLELKRKHGANPEDVARQEQEALGPSPRNEFAHPDEEPPAAVAADPAPPPPPRKESPPPGGGPRAGGGAAPAPPPNGAPPPDEAAPAAVAAGYEEDPWLDEDRDEVPAEEALQPRTEEEDVLEETPDFL